MNEIKAYITFEGDRADYYMSELSKYVSRMTRGRAAVVRESAPCEGGLTLGFLDELGLDTSDLDDPFIEDIVDIDVVGGVGHIAGSNQRSVLLGIYKYFTLAGCRFIRPGDDGEVIPERDLLAFTCKYRKKADYPFRGQCSEGAASYEHYRDMVYWMPKAGYNMFMIEGLVPYTYMHKWYGHIGNTVLRQKGQVTDYSFLEGKIAELEKDIVRTGMQFHNLGHGWMFWNFGEKGGSETLPEESMQYVAMRGGKREIKKELFYTQLCYSNPEVRRRLVKFVVDYLAEKPYIDYLHLWLADSTNNDCECENCVKMHPSDWYVMLLNEIDAELTRVGSKTRIVFIQYVETVRPPEKLRLNNPARFTLLTAVGVSYTDGYVNKKYDGETPEYKRNNFKPFPSLLSFEWMREWKRMHGGLPSMIFEYRYYIDQTNDPGYMTVTRETYRDMKNLKTLGLDGNMSDQSPRMFFPISLPMITEGLTLFDTGTDLEELMDDYFRTAFGENAKECRRYLETLSELFCPALLRKGGWVPVEDAGIAAKGDERATWVGNPDFVAKLSRVEGTVNAFMPFIYKNLEHADPCKAKSWRYLFYHAQTVKPLAKILIKAAGGEIEEAQRMFDDLMDVISRFETEIHDGFDFFLFFRNFRSKLKMPSVPYFD